MSEKIEKIEKISKVTEKGSVDEISHDNNFANLEVNKGQFDTLMMQERKQPKVSAAKGIDSVETAPRKPSLMEEVTSFNQKVDTAAKSDPKNIAIQANELVAQLDELKTKLSTPNLELKSSVQSLLQGKLSHIDESLKIALNKAGVEYVAPVAQKNLSTPIERFLGFLTDAQSQLEGLGKDVERMSLVKGQISPADMLAVQVKVGYVQNEIEFFTALINKALESTKTIMNIQV